MSAALSRQLARLKVFPPIRDLSPDDRRELNRVVHIVTTFEELPAHFQQAIVAAQTARDALCAAQRSGDIIADVPVEPAQPSRSA